MAAPETYEGPITLTKKGIGFFSTPLDPSSGGGRAPRDRDKSKDLLIPADATNHALHGDIVRVEPTGMHRDPTGRMPPRAAGRVFEVVSRARDPFVGTLVESPRGHLFLEPDYKRMHMPLSIRDAGSGTPGDKVLARLTGWPAGAELPEAAVEEGIGRAGVHDVEMRALALGQGFHPDFPPGVAAEAGRLEREGAKMLADEAAKARPYSAEATQGRRDFRTIPTLTIDPADAKDFDDALSVRTLTDGTIEVGIHIADVSFFVAPRSELDREARERATSVYLVDRTIPLLPHIL